MKDYDKNMRPFYGGEQEVKWCVKENKRDQNAG